MHKKYALIACLAVSLTGCASTQVPQVYLPGSKLSFEVSKDATLVHTYDVLGDCLYHSDDAANSHEVMCPPVMRIHHTRNGGLINVMAFPVPIQTLRQDTALLERLKESFDRHLVKDQFVPHKEAAKNDQYFTEVSLTWKSDTKGVVNESVVIFGVKGQPESTVVMVGQWPASSEREMAKVEEQIAADILGPCYFRGSFRP